jgi:uncharacterized protein (TIGR03437 family)
VEVDQSSWLDSARYSFLGWMDSSGQQSSNAATVTVTASPYLWSLTAVFDADYMLSLSYFPCLGDTPAACGGSPGTVTINDTSYWKDAFLWTRAGTDIAVEAVAGPGYVFAGWDNLFADPTAPVQTFKLSGGIRLQPLFVPSSNVLVVSSPPGLKVMVDGGVAATPRPYGWVAGSTHVIGPVSPQQDAGGAYWATQPGYEQQVYTVLPIQDPQILTVPYVRGAGAGVLTEPPNLRVKVDGIDNYPSPNYVWAVGSTHHLSAPLEQTDKAGRKYVFLGWSDGELNAVRDVTVGTEALVNPLAVVARYELLGRLSVESAPAGLKFLVDGSECLTPCTLDRRAGTRVAIVAPSTFPVSENTRLDFVAWQDQGSRERIWIMTADVQRLAAAYRTMHRVQAWADPAGGARFRFEPAAADGYYGAGAAVAVTAEAQPGFRFRRWAGDVEGTNPSASFLVNGPTSVIARMDRVPYIAPSGVVNAAAVTPVSGVAAGSIIAIYGESLAPSTEAGPASPLAQTIAGVTVQLSDRLLALFFVSPTQINALLPSDLPPGDYRLTVRWSGMPDVWANFTVVRNAPGLFANLMDTTLYAAATHADGTLVLPSSPARRGESITLYGTGLGPYLPKPPDGFAVPPEPAFPLADPVTIMAAELAITPQWARAAPGMLGVTAVRFQVPQGPPGVLPLKVIVNARESNTVMLPVE